MKHKKIIILLALTIFVLLSIGSVCATDADDTSVSSEDDSQIGLSQGNVITDNLKSSGEDTPLTQIENDDETLTVENAPNSLGVGEGNYSDLRDEIGEGGNVNLTKSYYLYAPGDGGPIIITTPGVIDGNGAVIDMAGLNVQALAVNTTNLTIKNLTIKNVNWFDEGGAILFLNGGTVINCNFINNTAAKGGAIEFYDGVGTVTNCIFTNNTAAGNGADGGEGAAIRTLYARTLNIDNCVFTNNTAISGDPEASPLLWTSTGAAIDTAADAVITNSIFNKNTAYSGGALYLSWGDVLISNSTFIDNLAETGGAIENLNSDVTVEYSKLLHNKANYEAGAISNDCSGKSIIRSCIFLDNVAGKACAVYNEVMGEEIGDLTIEDSLFIFNGGPDKHSIYNEGTLALKGNRVANIIYNSGKITSKTNVTVSANKNTNIKYGDSITLNAIFTDDNGNIIEDENLKFTVVGVENNIKSHYAGSIYTANYNVNTVGEKVVSAVLGYPVTVKTATINVKKATPKLTAKEKTFKKSVKTKKYAVTLKTSQNKAMKNSWVTLKINKKTYKVKTNSKGQATFKITNLKKKGTFKATVTYNGDKYYNKVTKNNVKIIVK